VKTMSGNAVKLSLGRGVLWSVVTAAGHAAGSAAGVSRRRAPAQVHILSVAGSGRREGGDGGGG